MSLRTDELTQFIEFLEASAGSKPVCNNESLADIVRKLLKAAEDRRTNWTSLSPAAYSDIKLQLDAAQADMKDACAQANLALQYHNTLSKLRAANTPSSEMIMQGLEQAERQWLLLKTGTVADIIMHLARAATTRDPMRMAMSVSDHALFTLKVDTFDAKFTVVFNQLELCTKNNETLQATFSAGTHTHRLEAAPLRLLDQQYTQPNLAIHQQQHHPIYVQPTPPSLSTSSRNTQYVTPSTAQHYPHQQFQEPTTTNDPRAYGYTPTSGYDSRSSQPGYSSSQPHLSRPTGQQSADQTYSHVAVQFQPAAVANGGHAYTQGGPASGYTTVTSSYPPASSTPQQQWGTAMNGHTAHASNGTPAGTSGPSYSSSPSLVHVFGESDDELAGSSSLPRISAAAPVAYNPRGHIDPSVLSQSAPTAGNGVNGTSSSRPSRAAFPQSRSNQSVEADGTAGSFAAAASYSGKLANWVSSQMSQATGQGQTTTAPATAPHGSTQAAALTAQAANRDHSSTQRESAAPTTGSAPRPSATPQTPARRSSADVHGSKVAHASGTQIPASPARSMLPLSPSKDRQRSVAPSTANAQYETSKLDSVPSHTLSKHRSALADSSAPAKAPTSTTGVKTSVESAANTAKLTAKSAEQANGSSKPATTREAQETSAPSASLPPATVPGLRPATDQARTFALYQELYAEPFRPIAAALHAQATNTAAKPAGHASAPDAGKSGLAFVTQAATVPAPPASTSGQKSKQTVPAAQAAPLMTFAPRSYVPTHQQATTRPQPTPYPPAANFSRFVYAPFIPIAAAPVTRPLTPSAPPPMHVPVKPASANRKTLAKDILRALGHDAPDVHTGKRKRGQARAVPSSGADYPGAAPADTDPRPAVPSTTAPQLNQMADVPDVGRRGAESGDIELSSFLVTRNVLPVPSRSLPAASAGAARAPQPHATIEEVESDVTLAPMNVDEPDETRRRSKEPPLFWSDTPSPEAQPALDSAASNAGSEADVDALLLRSPTPEAPAPAPRIRIPKLKTRVLPAARAEPAAAAGLSTYPPYLPQSLRPDAAIAFHRLRNSWPAHKPDRVAVVLPRLPAGWLPREQEVTYGEYDDFEERFCNRPCQWDSCPAVLDSERHLTTHWDKVHRTPSSNSNTYYCKWFQCTLRFSSHDKLQRHVRIHIRDCLRCAYEGCDFKTAVERDFAEHVAAHAAGELRPIAALRQIVPVQPLPVLPEGPAPTWRLVTPLVRPAAMPHEWKQQLGNWVLFKVAGKIDLGPVLIKTTAAQRKRRDYVPQLDPELEGFALELQQQFAWSESDETFKGPLRNPALMLYARTPSPPRSASAEAER